MKNKNDGTVTIGNKTFKCKGITVKAPKYKFTFTHHWKKTDTKSFILFGVVIWKNVISIVIFNFQLNWTKV